MGGSGDTEQTTGNQGSKAPEVERKTEGQQASGSGERTQSMFTLTDKDGAQRKLTFEEVQQELERAHGMTKSANQRMQEAATTRKEAEQAAEEARHYKTMLGDLKAANRGDTDAIRRLKTYPELEIPDEHIDALLTTAAKTQTDKESGTSGGTGTKGGTRKVTFEDLDPEVQEELAQFRQVQQREVEAQQEKVRDRLHDDLRRHLTTDKVLGHLFRHKQTGALGKVIERAFEFAKEALRRRAIDAMKVNDREWVPSSAFSGVAQETRQFLGDMGILGDSTSATEGTVEAAGGANGRRIRSVPSAGPTSFGPRAALYRDEGPVERPSSRNMDEYNKYLRQRYQEIEALVEG